jgi:cytochrome c2
MWRRPPGAAAAVVTAAAVTALAMGSGAAQEAPIPKSPGWELIMRCVICHSVEIAVQQRFGPQGWSDTLDRMIRYGAPIPPEDKQRLMAYLLQHYRDPNGR